MGQRRQHPRGGGRPGAVVECQHDFVVGERQRLRKAFQPDPWRGGGIDLENARGAERGAQSILARTVRRLRRRDPFHRDDKAIVTTRQVPSTFMSIPVRDGSASLPNAPSFVVAPRAAYWVMPDATIQTASITLSDR